MEGLFNKMSNSSFVVPDAALIIDKSAERVQQLATALRPEIVLENVDAVDSIFNAVQGMLNGDYHLCFFESAIPESELEVLVRDVRSMQGKGPVLFVEVHDEITPAKAPEILAKLEIAASIPRGLSEAQRRELLKVIFEFYEGPMRKQGSVAKFTAMILNEVDRVAYSKKRGVKTAVRGFVADHLRSLAEQDLTVKQGYFAKLEESVGKLGSPLSTELEIPEHMLKRKLPQLKKDAYQGVSHRAFKRLSKKFGKKKLGSNSGKG